MKKTIKILSLVLMLGGVVLLASCSKKKTCVCTQKYTGTGSQYMTDSSFEVTVDSGNCSDGNSTVTVAGLTAVTTCVQK